MATGRALEAGGPLFMPALPGATGSSRRLLLRGCICFTIGTFILCLLGMFRCWWF